MSTAKGAVEIADRRGNGGHLRVSWHPEKRVVNVSQWRGGICVSTTPVELSEVPALVNLLVGALEEAARMPGVSPGPPPVTGSGPGSPSPLRRRLWRWAGRRIGTRHLAPVIEMKTRSERSEA